MKLEEILKAKGLEDDVIKDIIGEMKTNKIFTAGEENLDIRYGKLKTEFENLTNQHGESTKLIEDLQKQTKGNEALQTQIAEWKAKAEESEKARIEAEKENALKIALLEAKATDVDYLTFKFKEKGEIELDESGKIKGLDDKIAGLKTQFPNQFESSANKDVHEIKLDKDNNGSNGMTKAELLKKPYTERNQFALDHPDEYNEIMNH